MLAFQRFSVSAFPNVPSSRGPWSRGPSFVFFAFFAVKNRGIFHLPSSFFPTFRPNERPSPIPKCRLVIYSRQMTATSHQNQCRRTDTNVEAMAKAPGQKS
jgi:hypothetical protein